MKNIVLLQKTKIADGLTLAQATEALTKANGKRLHELSFSIGPSEGENYALYSEPNLNSALFKANSHHFVIQIQDADKADKVKTNKKRK